MTLGDNPVIATGELWPVSSTVWDGISTGKYTISKVNGPVTTAGSTIVIVALSRSAAIVKS